MARSPLFEAERPLFSGHETFPVRYGWLKKAYDAVSAAHAKSSEKQVFSKEEAIRGLRGWQEHGGCHAPLGDLVRRHRRNPRQRNAGPDESR